MSFREMNKSRIILAPMEGVVDYHMRDLLTHIGGIDLCVTEFLRVSNTVFPERVFYKICPELRHDSKTLSGIPVRLQLLGQDAQLMAENALKAVSLGADSIDINFGCPAKTVNKHKGGAVLLGELDKLYEIVSTIRDRVPDHIMVSAKIRLGIEEPDNVYNIAQTIESAGCQELTIHARTKSQGYKPPVYWNHIKQVREKISMNVIANGDINSYENYHRCISEIGHGDIMIGRGLLMNPYLVKSIKDGDPKIASWGSIKTCLLYKAEKLIEEENPKYFPMRIKQWLNYLRVEFAEAELSFQDVKRMNVSKDILDYLLRS